MNNTKIILVACLLPFVGCTSCSENQNDEKQPPKAEVATELFSNVDDAFSTLLDKTSELQWEASHYLVKHPATAMPKLKRVIEEQQPSWFIAMCTLTDIGGASVVRFYCDLLDNNRYEMDQNGQRKTYAIGGMKPQYRYGQAIVLQIGRLGDKAADPCLQRAWLDSDNAVRSAVPKARYDIGTLTINDLVCLAKNDEKLRGLYFDALLEIAHANIHEKNDIAINIFELVSTSPEAENDIRTWAHGPLIQCYELRKNYQKALEHCDWVIENSENEEFANRRRIERPILLFHQGTLTQDDLFDLAKTENKLYDRIAQLGRHSDLSLLERIAMEAPPGSKYAMEAQYWKMEYFDHFNMPERANVQSQYILKNCTHDHVLAWVRKRQAKEKEIAELMATP